MTDKDWKIQDRSKDKPEYIKRCIHKQCKKCRGTGITKQGTICVHMISCKCPLCSPIQHY